MLFFKENSTPAENTIYCWNINSLLISQPNLSIFQSECQLSFRTMYSIIPNNTTYCSEQCKYVHDIIPQYIISFPRIIKLTLTSCGIPLIFCEKHLTFCSKLWYFARNVDFSPDSKQKQHPSSNHLATEMLFFFPPCHSPKSFIFWLKYGLSSQLLSNTHIYWFCGVFHYFCHFFSKKSVFSWVIGLKIGLTIFTRKVWITDKFHVLR